MIENPCDLSASDLREWAYNEDVELMDQDEDLLLHDINYVPVLLECARDIECPKAGDIISILSYFGQLRLLHRVIDEAVALSQEIDRQIAMLGGAQLEPLRFLVAACRQLVSAKPLSIEEVDRLAYDLLIRNTVRVLEITGRVASGYREYTFEAPYPVFLYINPDSGEWRYSKMKRLTSVA